MPRVCTFRIASRPFRQALHRPHGGRNDRAGAARNQDLRTVGRGDDDHARRRIEAVHLGEDLVQRLLALVVAAAGPATPDASADRVD
jgi:hypothetical protein